MFKKIEAWVLHLTILIGLLFSIFFGWLVYQEMLANQTRANQKFPFLSKTAVFLVEIPMNLKQMLVGNELIVRIKVAANLVNRNLRGLQKPGIDNLEFNNWNCR